MIKAMQMRGYSARTHRSYVAAIKVISEKDHTKRRVGNLLPTRLVCQAATYGFGV